MFHVSPTPLPSNYVLQPGSWGTKLKTILTTGNQSTISSTLFWEMALETARYQIDPFLPSRLNCVFLSQSMDDAVGFRDQFRPGGHIYEVEMMDDVPFHRGDFSLLSYNSPNVSFLDFMPQFCIRYWTEQPSGIVEVIYPGRAKIVGQVDEPQHALTPP